MSIAILDGALGTELQRWGARMDAPLWSAHALIDTPEIVADVHAEYLRAGANVITTNTFRTHARNLAAAGREHEAEMLTRRAVTIALGAREQVLRTHADAAKARVAGSVSPLEDSFSPDRSPDYARAKAEHTTMARTLVDAGVDLLLIETMSCVHEAVAAAEAASGLGVPVWLAIVGREDGNLLGGESTDDLIAALAQPGLDVDALLVNCTDIAYVDATLSALRASLAKAERTDLTVGAYPHTGRHDPETGFRTHACTRDEFAAKLSVIARRHELGIVGSCCGSTPAWTAELKRRLDLG